VSAIARRLSAVRFLRFAVVGAGGFIVDTGVLFLMHRGVGLDPYSARAISIFIAMNFTWLGNRSLTFRDKAATRPREMAAEWARFVSANALGAIANYSAYAALVRFAPWPVSNPYLALIVGVAVGLALNFTLSHQVVFRGGEQTPS